MQKENSNIGGLDLSAKELVERFLVLNLENTKLNENNRERYILNIINLISKANKVDYIKKSEAHEYHITLQKARGAYGGSFSSFGEDLLFRALLMVINLIDSEGYRGIEEYIVDSTSVPINSVDNYYIYIIFNLSSKCLHGKNFNDSLSSTGNIASLLILLIRKLDIDLYTLTKEWVECP